MHFVCRFGFDYDFADALLLAIPHERSVFFLDALQNVRCARGPGTVREYRVAEGEFGQSHLTAAEKCRWIWPKRRMNTCCRAKLQNCLNACIHPHADCCAIFRSHERLPGGHLTFVTVI